MLTSKDTNGDHEKEKEEEVLSPLIKPKKSKKKFSLRDVMHRVRDKLGLVSKETDRPLLFHIMNRRK